MTLMLNSIQYDRKVITSTPGKPDRLLTSMQFYQCQIKLKPYYKSCVSPAGAPITPYIMTKILRDALVGSHHANPSSLTCHAIRRGAAHPAIKSGASIQSVMDLGTCLSSPVYNYVPKPVVKQASVALAKCLVSVN